MSIEQDPEIVDNGDEDFEKHFNEIAASKSAPLSEDATHEEKSEVEPDLADASADKAPEEGEKKEPPSDDKAGADKAPDDKAPDPWAEAPENLREQYQKVMQELERTRHAALSDRNRVAALSRKLHSLTATAEREKKASEPTEAQKALDAKLAKLKEEAPEVAEPIIEALEAQREQLKAVKEMTDTVARDRDEAIVAAQLQALQKMHPDFLEIREDEKWGIWLAEQPSNIQALANSWDAREVSVALTLFKTDMMEAAPKPEAEAEKSEEKPKAKSETDTKREQQLEAAADVRSKPAPLASGPPEDFEAAFEYFRKRREAAARR